MVEVCVCHDADIDIAARTLYGLCRGEPLEGQQAIAWVIRTRSFSGGLFGRSVKEVCLRHDDHFPCWERNGPERAALLALRDDAPDLPELRDIVRAVFEGDVPDPACDAKGRHPTHFERIGAGSAWAKGKPIAKVIGCHAFYVIA